MKHLASLSALLALLLALTACGTSASPAPEVPYFPITDGAPLTDYAPIDNTTPFEVDEEGNVVIYFSAGAVTDQANGEQSFRIPPP